MILKLLKGIVKKVIGKASKQAQDEGSSKNLLDLADDLIDNDEEIQNQIQEFLTNFEGRYKNLRTKFEAIVRTITRPFLTVMFSVNLIIMVWLDKAINQYIGYCTVILVASWCGTKAFRDWKKARMK